VQGQKIAIEHSITAVSYTTKEIERPIILGNINSDGLIWPVTKI